MRIEAKYDVKCEKLSDTITRSTVQSLADTHLDQVDDIICVNGKPV